MTSSNHDKNKNEEEEVDGHMSIPLNPIQEISQKSDKLAKPVVMNAPTQDPASAVLCSTKDEKQKRSKRGISRHLNKIMKPLNSELGGKPV